MEMKWPYIWKNSKKERKIGRFKSTGRRAEEVGRKQLGCRSWQMEQLEIVSGGGV